MSVVHSVTINGSEKTGSFPGSSTQNDLLYSGSIDSEEFNLDDLDFSKIQSGYNKFILTVTDQVGNVGKNLYCII